MKLKRQPLLALVVALFLSACGGLVQSAGGGSQPALQKSACPFELPPTQLEGESVECFYLLVPEDRSHPGGRTIRLAVALFHNPDGTSAPDPIIYLSGGPGGSALELARYSFDATFAPLFESGRDVIVFDQRGVGYSQPALDCPEVTRLTRETMDGELDGKAISTEEARDLVLQALRACGDDLSRVADLSAYHSLASAADVEDLRRALGYEKINLWGGSYGTRLALEVIRQHPQGLRSVVLDAVYPPDVDLYVETPANFERASQVLFEHCAADPACNAAYPDLRATFFVTVERLNAETVSLHIRHPLTGKYYTQLLDGDGLLALLFRYLYFTEVVPFLPQVISEAHQGDFSKIIDLQGSQLIRDEVASIGMQLSVQCHEETSFSSQAALDDLLAQRPELRAYIPAWKLGYWTFEICTGWGAGRADPQANQAVVSNIPTLLMAGEYDPITPPAWAEHAAETLPNGYYFLYPGVGHGAGVVEGCPRQMLIDFVEDPSRPPDDRCIADMELEFTLPVHFDALELVPVNIPTYGIQAVAPQGWQELPAGHFTAADYSISLVIKEERDERLEDFLASLGASTPYERLAANGREWELYSFGGGSYAGLVAVSPSQAGFYLVQVLGASQDLQDLHRSLLAPVIQAFSATQ